MPNIPDIKPEINITFKDSINLLLKSIAEEEISLSKLMDAEKDKILYVLTKYKNNKAEVGDLLSVNSSVDRTITDLIKMQMLLQFKLESVKELLPIPPRPCPPPCPSPPPCCPKPVKRKCHDFWYLLMGKCKGEASNQSDDFFGRKVVIEVFVSSYNYKENIINYYVGGNCTSLCFTAYANNIKIECPCETKPDKIKISGNARLTKMSAQKKTFMNVNFKLLVRDDNTGNSGFQMIIESPEDKTVIHDSGFVCAKGLNLYCSA